LWITCFANGFSTGSLGAIKLDDSKYKFNERKLLSPKGRFGRLQLACWGTLFLMLPRLLSATVPIGLFLLPITFPLYIFSVLKRLRDLGLSPWWGLVAWIPLLNIPLLFIPGKKGENKYGFQPTKPTSSERIFGILLPIAFVGIIASSVLPAYQENYEYYKNRAEQEQAPNK